MYLWLSANYVIILRVSAKSRLSFVHEAWREKATAEIFPAVIRPNLTTKAEFTCSKLIGMLKMGRRIHHEPLFSPENIQEMLVGLKVGERGIS